MAGQYRRLAGIEDFRPWRSLRQSHRTKPLAFAGHAVSKPLLKKVWKAIGWRVGLKCGLEWQHLDVRQARSTSRAARAAATSAGVRPSCQSSQIQEISVIPSPYYTSAGAIRSYSQHNATQTDCTRKMELQTGREPFR